MVKNVNNVYSNIREIKREALEENIPIMQDETMDFITDYIEKKNIKKITEQTIKFLENIILLKETPNYFSKITNSLYNTFLIFTST